MENPSPSVSEQEDLTTPFCLSIVVDIAPAELER